MLAVAPPAAAEFRVRPAAVEEGEIALENNGSYAIARSPQRQGEQSYTAEVEWAPLSWWLPELEGEGGRDQGPDQPTRVLAVALRALFAHRHGRLHRWCVRTLSAAGAPTSLER